MADELMADGREILNLENRPFHQAYLSGKVACPYVECRTELGRTFFEQALKQGLFSILQQNTEECDVMKNSNEMRGDCLN